MIDGNYYMDGESFIHVKEHFMGVGDIPMIYTEMVKFSHGLGHYEHIGLVEEACDRRMVPSSQEEFEIVKNLYLSCHKAIDTLNTQWFKPRWKEKRSDAVTTD